MNIKEAKEQIRNAITAYFSKDVFGNYEIPIERQRPVFLMGPPGIGKTAVMEQIAAELGVGLVSYSMTHHTRQSALGLPYIEKKRYGGQEYSVSEYTMSEIIASVYDMMESTGVKEGILFLDEINCVSETLAPAMLQFLQYKIFGRHRVPDGWIVVTAGNPPEYNNSVREFDIVTWDRLKRIDVEPDYEAWKEYASRKRTHPAILTYLNKIEGQLKKFVINNYKDYSGDLFSVFTYRNLMFCKQDGYCGYMTPFVWMFIKTYEKLREFIIRNKSIATLVQMEYSAFEEATVPICSFVLKNGKATENGLYFKLSDFKGGMEVQKQKVLEALANKNCGYFYEADQSNFSKIPGSPVAYWVSSALTQSFIAGTPLGEVAKPRQGMATTNNNRFLRLWHEIPIYNIGFGLNGIDETVGEIKWFPYNKGGDFRKWYGNNDYIVNFQNKGQEVCAYIDATSAVNSKGRVINRDCYFHECMSWSLISIRLTIRSQPPK